MNQRQAYIANRAVLADSGEMVTDISLRDPITALWVEMRAQNGATYNKASFMASCIKTVELIDGSDVLVSLDGYEAFALGCYHLGYIPYNLVCESGSLYQNCFFPIFFGRWLGDDQMSLDATKFSNLQLRFKWDLAAVNAVGATGFLSGSGRLTVMATVMEGAGAPSGYLAARQHYNFTTAASGTTYIDLPTDYPLKALYLRSYKAASGGVAGISNVKVNCGQGKFVPVDMGVTDLVRWLTMFYPPMHYKQLVVAANGNTCYWLLKKDEVIQLQGTVADTVITAVQQGVGETALIITTAGSADSTQREIDALVEGWLPVSTAYLPFGDPTDPGSYFNPTPWGNVRLELTNSEASAASYVVLEQAKPY